MSAQAAIYGAQAGIQLAGGYFASQNIKATAKLNRDIADMNAQFAELDAYDASIEAGNDAARYQETIDQTLSQQQANLTSAGVDVNYGSVADVQTETRFIGELNKMEIQRRGQEQALGYQRQARDYRLGGTLQYGDALAKASSARFSGITGAIDSGLTGYQRSR